VEYGPDPAALTAASENFVHCPENSARADLTLDCLPGLTYSVRAFVRDAATGDVTYSDFQTIEFPPFSGVLLPEGTHTLTLERNETRSYFSLTAETAGEYTVRIDGPDGVFTYWDRGWKEEQFTLRGHSATLPLAAGETAYFTVKGYSPGEYHLSYTFTGSSRTEDAAAFVRSFVPENDGFCFAAAYDAAGKMLTAERKTMTAGERCTVSMPYQADMAYVKVFRTSDALSPLCPPEVAEAISAPPPGR
jgi:hypothetical protein